MIYANIVKYSNIPNDIEVSIKITIDIINAIHLVSTINPTIPNNKMAGINGRFIKKSVKKINIIFNICLIIIVILTYTLISDKKEWVTPLFPTQLSR